MKTFSIITGIILLIVTAGSGVCWAMGFEMLQAMLVDGAPLFFEHAGDQIQIPGRLIGALMLIIPITCLITGVWLIKSGIDR